MSVRRTLATAVGVAQFLQFSCSGRPANKIQGEYLLTGKPNVSLSIDRSTIRAGEGPFQFTARYKVMAVDGNRIVLEVTAPNTPKGSATVLLKETGIRVTDNFLFGGDWTRR